MGRADRVNGVPRIKVLLVFVALLTACAGILADAAPAGAADKRVACALPFVQGGPNFFCSDLHQVLFFTDGYTSNESTIVAELLAMDTEGTVLRSMPVHAGDFVRMTSITSLPARITQKNNLFTVTAPIAVLHVTADDGVTKHEAFCSNIPFLRVLKPDNSVVSVSNPADDVVQVLAAIPLVDPANLAVIVDGTDVLAQLGIGNPVSCSPTAPCGGTVQINGKPVTIANLIVDSGPISQYAANTVSFTVTGLGCGGHLFSLESNARPGSQARFVSPTCHDDPISAKSLSSGFGITIEKPLDFQTGLTFPVNVKGEVCSGRPITVFSVNAQPFDVVNQTVTPGNGTTTADTYKFPFDIEVGETDVKQDVTVGDGVGYSNLKLFDLGSNRLVLGARDDVGNRTVNTRFFGTGQTVQPGIEVAAAVAESIVNETARKIVGPLSTVEIQDAFVIGMSAKAVQAQVTAKCTAPRSADNDFKGGVGTIFRDALFAQLQPNAPLPAKIQIPLCSPPDPPCGTTTNVVINPDCSCAVSVPVWITQIDVDANDISCPLTFQDDVIHVAVNLPTVAIHIEMSKDGMGTPATCEVDGEVCVPFTDICTPGVCLERTNVGIRTKQTISGINVKFDIDKDTILKDIPAPAPPCPAPGKVDPAHPEKGCFFAGTRTPEKPTKDDLEFLATPIECVISDICELGAIAINWIVSGITDLFGDAVDPKLGGVDFNLDPNFSNQIGLAQPDQFGLKKMGINKEKVEEHNQTLEGIASSAHINSAGILLGLKGKFAALQVDPEVQTTTGASITHPPLPIMPVAFGGDAFIALSTDTLNMLSAGLTVGGALKTTCKPLLKEDGVTKKTVGDLLPKNDQGVTDCDSFHSDTHKNSVSAVEQGVCHGINLASCESLAFTNPDPLDTDPVDLKVLTAIKQGACHGFKGDNCSSIPVPAGLQGLKERIAEQATCGATGALNIRADHHVLTCTRQDIPPRILPTAGGGADPVSAILRLIGLSVAVVLDRDDVGVLDTSLAETPTCSFNTRTGQCALVETCLDINLNLEMQFVPPAPGVCNGKPGIKNIAKHVQIVTREKGAICGATPVPGKKQILEDSASNEAVEKDLPTQAQEAAPPICMEGLDVLNKIVPCSLPNLFTIETNGKPEFKDFLGVGCSTN